MIVEWLTLWWTVVIECIVGAILFCIFLLGVARFADWFGRKVGHEIATFCLLFGGFLLVTGALTAGYVALQHHHAEVVQSR